MKLIDIHTHSRKQESEVFFIRNAFHKLDKNSLEQLPYPVSVGLHPWHIGENYMAQLQKMKATFEAGNVLAIGETGIDKNIAISQEVQKKVFHWHIIQAENLQKPLILHQVKAFYECLSLLKSVKIPFIFHSFSGNEAMIKATAKLNAYFSIGPKVLSQPKLKQVLNHIPKDKLLLETDTGKAGIEEIYAFVALQKKISIFQLEACILQNFKTLFKIDPI